MSDEVERVRPEPWKDGRLPAVTCSARRSNGDPCKRPPIKGARVCATHGGSAPAVKRAAQVRLLMAADRLMAGLLKIAEDKSEPTPVRLAAIRDALDRAGLNAKQEFEVDVKLSRWDAAVDAVTVVERIIDAEVIEDAEVVEESPEPDEPSDTALTEALDNARRKRARQGKSTALTTGERNAIEARHSRPRRSLVEPEPPTVEPSRPNHPGPTVAKQPRYKPPTAKEQRILDTYEPPRRKRGPK